MKKILVFLFLSCSILGMWAQKIKTSEVDKFNKSKHIETSWVNLRKNVMDLKDVNAMFYAFNGNNYLRIKINNTENAIPQGATIILLSDNGETCEFVVSETAIPDKGKGATSIMGSARLGVDVLSKGDLDFFGNNTISAIRFNTGDGYVDYDVKPDNAKKLSKAYALFKKELSK